MESSLIALELVHEHRNYVPSIGVLFALCFGAARLFASGSHQRLSQIAAGLAVVLCASMTFLRAGDWSDPATLAVVEAQRHPNSERAVYDLGRIQFGLYELTEREEFYDQGIANLEHAVELDPNIKQPLIGVMRMAYEFDHALKPEWMPEALRRYEHTLFHPSETDDLNRLVQCRAKENCTFPAQDVFQLYFAALRNPSLPEFSKAQLMVDLAAFYVNESYELEPAMNLLDDAVTAFPTEFNFRKVRAQIYLMAERYNEVAEETRFMRSVPRWSDVINSPVGEISAIEQALAETMNREVRENP
jgi:protein O-mannosyl-transferase